LIIDTIKNSNNKRYFFIPFFLIIFHLILIIFWPYSSFLVKIPPEIAQGLSNPNEYSPAEISEAIFYFIAIITSLKNLLIFKSERKIYFFIFLISFILFAEETSWMTHYLNYSIPIIENINAQNEVNIHNLFFFQGGSLRDGNFSLDYLLKSQNLFRILFCFYFFLLPLISQKKVFKKYFKKYIFLKPSKNFIISLVITLSFSIVITLIYGYNSPLKNPIAELRELIYSAYICFYILDLRKPYKLS